MEKTGRWSLIDVKIKPEETGLQISLVKILSISVALEEVILVGRAIKGWNPILFISERNAPVSE